MQVSHGGLSVRESAHTDLGYGPLAHFSVVEIHLLGIEESNSRVQPTTRYRPAEEVAQGELFCAVGRASLCIGRIETLQFPICPMLEILRGEVPMEPFQAFHKMVSLLLQPPAGRMRCPTAQPTAY